MDLDQETGEALEGWSSVAQSIRIILGTRLNSRVFLREFGSEIPALVDAPMNDQGVLSLHVAVAEALDKWEPRFELTNVQVAGLSNGVITMTLSGNYRPKAHLGDLTSVRDEVRTIRLLGDRVENWRIAA